METIEERYGCSNCQCPCCEGCDSFLLVKGASEQKKIDIDIFKKWLSDNSKITLPEENRVILSELLKRLEE